jgi:hypothetical protein
MMSNVKRELQRLYEREGNLNYLISDSGYPQEPWLMVPFGDVPNSPESRYNNALSRLRIAIEHLNGILKSRFRCLLGHRALNYNPIRAAKIIYTCAVLHNMCRAYNVPLPENNEIPHVPVPHVDNQANNGNWQQEGARLRRRIVARYFPVGN